VRLLAVALLDAPRSAGCCSTCGLRGLDATAAAQHRIMLRNRPSPSPARGLVRAGRLGWKAKRVWQLTTSTASARSNAACWRLRRQLRRNAGGFCGSAVGTRPASQRAAVCATPPAGRTAKPLLIVSWHGCARHGPSQRSEQRGGRWQRARSAQWPHQLLESPSPVPVCWALAED